MSIEAAGNTKIALCGDGCSSEGACRGYRGMRGDSTARSKAASHNDVVVLQLHGNAATRMIRAGPDIDCTPAWVLLFLRRCSELQGSGDHRSRAQVSDTVAICQQRNKEEIHPASTSACWTNKHDSRLMCEAAGNARGWQRQGACLLRHLIEPHGVANMAVDVGLFRPLIARSLEPAGQLGTPPRRIHNKLCPELLTIL